MTIADLLTRQCNIGGGTQVTNCLVHIRRSLTDRPSDCQLCSTDIQNRLRLSIAVNGWLNQWKEDATRMFRRANAEIQQPVNESREEPRQEKPESRWVDGGNGIEYYITGEILGSSYPQRFKTPQSIGANAETPQPVNESREEPQHKK